MSTIVGLPSLRSEPAFEASPSQRAAIEAPLGPLLVLAGPGAGKTYCLIERIRYLISHHGIDPARIRTFTFTNKAADEVASRLVRELDAEGPRVRRGTIHAYCAELLREFGELVGLKRGFGIADEDYQKSVLGRLGVPARFHGAVVKRLTLNRLLGTQISQSYQRLFAAYARFLERRNLVDFDGLVLKTAALLDAAPDVAAEVRSRWDYVLVDEFQDLNRPQYAIVSHLVAGHRNLFAVGDHEQSIFSWTGADPRLFNRLTNELDVKTSMALAENYRCPRDTFALARMLVERNTPLLSVVRAVASRESPFPVRAVEFEHDGEESSWLLDDLLSDREQHGLEWGDIALLYRRHEIGDGLEAALIAAGIPCRLAQGRALADDPVVAYVIAALRVIANPRDSIQHEQFLRVVLPRLLWSQLRAQAEERREPIRRQVVSEARRRGRQDEDGRKLRRGLAALRNLEAVGQRHTSLAGLVEELLSQRVGEYRTVLEERHDELIDPASNGEVVALANCLAAAREGGREVCVERLGGAGIPLAGMLNGAGFAASLSDGGRPAGSVTLRGDEVPALGIALGLFKALQLVAARESAAAFRDFTAIDVETTDRDLNLAEIVDLAAVRVRGGEPVEEYQSLVRPRGSIAPGATAVHGLTAADVAGAPGFEEVWPAFREFCGNDILVAHNGYEFDFKILRRLSRTLAGSDFCTYDTLVLARELHPGSRKLGDLAHEYHVDTGRAHRALDDARTLARVLPALDRARLVRARKTALVNLLDYLGVALALENPQPAGEEERREVERLFDIGRIWALGRYSDALERYDAEREALGDSTLPTAEQVIARLGGRELMLRLRAERSADQRYPAAMARLRRILAQCGGETLSAQIGEFLERAALSARHDGVTADKGRVNLLTLHATKGLEFSRVYVVGVEDAEFIGAASTKQASEEQIEEGRRLLYVGMTRARERLVLTRVQSRRGRPTGGHRFLDEMGLDLVPGRS